MDDRTLLELAAKAAGMRLTENGVRDFGDWEFLGEGSVNWGLYRNNANGTQRKWNPITDDGDALRLAVKLGIGVLFDLQDEKVTAYEQMPHDGYHVEFAGEQGPTAATRRAIVRAAAELGRQTNG